MLFSISFYIFFSHAVTETSLMFVLILWKIKCEWNIEIETYQIQKWFSYLKGHGNENVEFSQRLLVLKWIFEMQFFYKNMKTMIVWKIVLQTAKKEGFSIKIPHIFWNLSAITFSKKSFYGYFPLTAHTFQYTLHFRKISDTCIFKYLFFCGRR